jgi:hypothetical protein
VAERPGHEREAHDIPRDFHDRAVAAFIRALESQDRAHESRSSRSGRTTTLVVVDLVVDVDGDIDGDGDVNGDASP